MVAEVAALVALVSVVSLKGAEVLLVVVGASLASDPLEGVSTAVSLVEVPTCVSSIS